MTPQLSPLPNFSLIQSLNAQAFILQFSQLVGGIVFFSPVAVVFLVFFDEMDLISSQETLLLLKNKLAVNMEFILGSVPCLDAAVQSGCLQLIFTQKITVSRFHILFTYSYFYRMLKRFSFDVLLFWGLCFCVHVDFCKL